MKYARWMAIFVAFSWAESALAQTIAVRPDGREDVVWLDPNGYLEYFWTIANTGWKYSLVDTYQHAVAKTGFTIQGGLGAAIAVRPGGYLNSMGETDIAAVGLFHQLFYYHSSSVGWQLCFGNNAPGCGLDSDLLWYPDTITPQESAFSAPALAVRPSGEADIVVEGPNNSLMHYHATPGAMWTHEPIAGNNTTYSAPSIAVLPTGEVAVVAQGPNGSLSLYTSTTPQPTGPSTWTPQTILALGTEPSGITFPVAGIAARATGEVDVAGPGADGSLIYFSSTNPPYSTWQQSKIDGPGNEGLPIIAVRLVTPVGQVDVVASNSLGQLVYYYATPTPSNPDPLWTQSVLPTGVFQASPRGIAISSSNPAGGVDIVAVDDAFATLLVFSATPGSPWSPYTFTNYSGAQNNP